MLAIFFELNMYFYKNGNTSVMILANGTKIRHVPDGETPRPERPESIDVKITDKCNNNCWFCYEHSKSSGLHGDLNHPIFDSIESGTELALGGGNPLLHPDLDSFLSRMLKQGVICNLTIHQDDYVANKQRVDMMLSSWLIKGLGISVGDGLKVTPDIECTRAIYHTILGITSVETIISLAERRKVLLMGNKTQPVDLVTLELIRNFICRADIIASLFFDNLACDQLDVKSLVSAEEWNERYMGDDGTFTMYIDVINQIGYTSSVQKDVGYALTNNIRDVFRKITASS
jgi:hypothetical protein